MSNYLLVALAAEQNPEFRRRVVTACEFRGKAFTEQALLSVLYRFKHTLQPVTEVIGVTVPINDANIDTALNEFFAEEDNGNNES